MRKSLIALLVGVGLVSTTWAATTTIIDTDFTSGDSYSDGTIIGQNSWEDMLGTDTNAYEITNSGTTGEADGSLTTGDFTTNGVGQFAYLNTASASNNVGDEWTGVMDFQISTVSPGKSRADLLSDGTTTTANKPMARIADKLRTGGSAEVCQD